MRVDPRNKFKRAQWRLSRNNSGYLRAAADGVWVDYWDKSDMIACDWDRTVLGKEKPEVPRSAAVSLIAAEAAMRGVFQVDERVENAASILRPGRPVVLIDVESELDVRSGAERPQRPNRRRNERVAMGAGEKDEHRR
jgi:hypothetical protein